MTFVYDKKLTDIWQSKAMELGIISGEFEVDGIEFVSEEDESTENGYQWYTHTVWANGKEIYYNEVELAEETA